VNICNVSWNIFSFTRGPGPDPGNRIQPDRRAPPISLKQLFPRGIGSVATVQRRLSRLKRIGIVTQGRTDNDKRVVTLALTPRARRIHSKWAEHLRRSLR
jgi:DNA-binding MarR family transcriptional regulator